MHVFIAVTSTPPFSIVVNVRLLNVRLEDKCLTKLFFLYAQEGTSSTHDVEIDLDEVLDMDGDEERRKFLLPLLVDAKKSQDIVNVSVCISCTIYDSFNRFVDFLFENFETHHAI